MKAQILAIYLLALSAVLVHGRPADAETAPLDIIDEIRKQLEGLELADGGLDQVLAAVEQILLPNGELVSILELPGALSELTDQLSSLGLEEGVVAQILKIVIEIVTKVLGSTGLPELPELPELPVGDIPIVDGLLGGR